MTLIDAPALVYPTMIRLTALTRRTTPTQAVVAAAAVLTIGSLISILTTPDPLWWHLHFSRLGTFAVFSGYAFNATIVAASAMLVLFAVRLRVEMVRHAGSSVLSHRRAALVVPGLVALIGIHLSLVGFSPLDVNLFVHERGSSGAVLSFAALLVSSRWLLKGMHRRVARATRRVLGALGVFGTLFATGRINLAAFEFIVFALMFAWLVVMTRQLGVPSEVEPTPAGTRIADLATISPRKSADHVVSAARALPTEAHRPHVHPTWRPPVRAGHPIRRQAAHPDRRRRGDLLDARERLPRGCTASGARRASVR